MTESEGEALCVYCRGVSDEQCDHCGHQNVHKCFRCGGQCVVLVEGVWLCDVERGGCNRPTRPVTTAPLNAEWHQDPAFERDIMANGTGPISTAFHDNPDVLLDGFGANDLGNAHRFVKQWGQSLRYVKEWDWLVYTGKRWDRDSTEFMMRCAKDVTRIMLVRAAKHLQVFQHDETHKEELEQAKKLIKHAEASMAARRLSSMIDLARSEVDVIARHVEFDKAHYLFNADNGTIDLITGEVRPFSQEDWITRVSPTAYYADATCPLWEKFLKDVFIDPNVVNYVQRVVGYTLTGDCKEQLAFILHGNGSNGKSTFLNVLQRIFGDDYTAVLNASALMPQRPGQSTNDFARLRGKRLVTTVEVGSGRHMDEEQFKKLTGRDKISARFLYKEAFEFYAEFKLFIAANHKPQMSQDPASWRRIRLIPFLRTFTDKDKDPDLEAKLVKEAPGILAWAVRGCQEWLKSGLVTPDVVAQATLDYRSENNDLDDFLSTYTWAGPTLTCEARELYVKYRDWVESRREKAMSQNAFGRKLTDLGYKPGKQGGVRVWHGLSTEPHTVTMDKYEQAQP